MRFLTKHYEKIVLAISLLIFIISLVYLIVVFSQSMVIKPEDLLLKNNKPDYVQVFDETGKVTLKEGETNPYNFNEILKKGDHWMKSLNRGTKIPVSTDLMVPFKAARCFYCKKIIPLIYFDKEQDCILCHKSLHRIKTEATKDIDKDQMPDDWEKKYDLEPMKATDKMLDKDEDGFPNFIEFIATPQTEPNNPKSHPSLALGLNLKGLKRNKLPIILKSVMKNGEENKDKWLVQVKNKFKGKWRTTFVKIGETVKMGDEEYKLTDINFKMKDVYNKKIKQPVPTNVSEIVIDQVDAKQSSPVVVKMKQPVYKNAVKIVLVDSIDDKVINTFIGDKFKIGNDVIGVESFTVKSINYKSKKNKGASIVIQADDKNKTEYVIGQESKLQMQIDDIEGADDEVGFNNLVPKKK